MEHVVLWAEFAAASAIVIGAGLSLTKNADRLAMAMGWGQAFAGFVILGWATSLPEVVISVSSAVTLERPGQATGNITGSVIFNLAILALLDLLADPGAGRGRSKSQGIGALTAFNVVSLIGLGVLALPAVEAGLPPATAGLFLVAGYLAATLHAYVRKGGDEEEAAPNLSALNTAGACLLAGAVILGAGLWLSKLGDRLATTYALEEGLVGTIFLGAVSSLPELVTGLAAVRLGLMTMAAASILGSNIFNLGILGTCELLWVFGADDRRAMIVSADDPRMGANLAAGLLLTFLAYWLVSARRLGATRRRLAGVASAMLVVYVGVLTLG